MQEIHPLAYLFFVAIACSIMMAGAAHIFGGAAWSRKVLAWEIRVVRALLGYPLIWAGQIVTGSGRIIAGKGRIVPRLPH